MSTSGYPLQNRACFPPASWGNHCPGLFFLSGMMLPGFFFSWARILCRVLSGMFNCFLMKDRGTLVFQSLMASLLFNLLWPWFSWVFVDRRHGEMQLAQNENVGLLFYHAKQKSIRLRTLKICVLHLNKSGYLKEKDCLPRGPPGRLKSLNEQRPSLMSPAVQ
jgi:hypothetical protein